MASSHPLAVSIILLILTGCPTDNIGQKGSSGSFTLICDTLIKDVYKFTIDPQAHSAILKTQSDSDVLSGSFKQTEIHYFIHLSSGGIATIERDTGSLIFVSDEGGFRGKCK